MSHINEPIYFHNDILCHYGDKAFADRGKWRNTGGKKPPLYNFPWYIYNIEDISIENLDEIRGVYERALYISNKKEIILPRQEFRILILRDPFNLLASRYRFFKRMNDIRRADGKRAIEKSAYTNGNSKLSWYRKDVIYRWKEYARECLGETGFVNNKIFIDYNSWFSNKEYRKKIAKSFGFSFTDRKLNFIPHNGGGSSFDLREKDGDAQKMDVLNRWKKLEGDNMFVNFFRDDELISLSKRLYPKLTEQVIEGLGI
jgi:hypothetical protein